MKGISTASAACLLVACAAGMTQVQFDPSLGVRLRAQDLNHRDPKVRQQMAEDFGKYGNAVRDATQALRRALGDGNDDVRAAAARALAELGPSAWGAVGDLADALNDKSEKVRVNAADALAQMGPLAKQAVPALIKALKDESVLVRRRVATAIGQIGAEGKAAVPALIEALRDKDVAKSSREVSFPWAAATALGRIGPEAKAAIPELIELIKSDDVQLRYGAVQALGRIGPQHDAVIPALRALLRNKEDPRLGGTAAHALGHMGSAAKPAISDLVDLLNFAGLPDADAAHYIRSGVFWALGQIDQEGKTAVPVLANAMKDERLEIRTRQPAVHALGKLGPAAKAAIPALVDLLKANTSLSGEVSTALGRIGPTAVPALVELVKDKGLVGLPGNPRGYAVQALGYMGPAAKEAIPVLTHALNDQSLDAYVRNALARISQ